MNSLCCELLPWRLASGGLTSCLLGMGHLEKEKICLVGGKMREKKMALLVRRIGELQFHPRSLSRISFCLVTEKI